MIKVGFMGTTLKKIAIIPVEASSFILAEQSAASEKQCEVNVGLLLQH
jgi:hypothetical protein